jgi:hypothetical protein
MTVNEIIAAIQQAAADAMDYPGKTETGALLSEEGDLVTDSRIVDGFKVKIVANKLILTYSKLCRTKGMLAEVIDNKFEGKMKQTVDGLAKYLKKEFKGKTNKALRLKEDGELVVRVDPISSVRSNVVATQVYDINNYDAFTSGTEGEAQERYDKIDEMMKEGYRPELAWKKWAQK